MRLWWIECRGQRGRKLVVVVVQPRVGNGRSGGVPYLLPETFEEIEKEKKTKWEMWSFLFGCWDGESRTFPLMRRWNVVRKRGWYSLPRALSVDGTIFTRVGGECVRWDGGGQWWEGGGSGLIHDVGSKKWFVVLQGPCLSFAPSHM